MSISVRCPACHKRYQVRDDKAGRTLACKECGTAMTVPAAGVSPSSGGRTAPVGGRKEPAAETASAGGGVARRSPLLKAGAAVASLLVMATIGFFIVRSFLGGPAPVETDPVGGQGGQRALAGSEPDSPEGVPHDDPEANQNVEGGDADASTIPAWPAWGQTPPPDDALALLEEMTQDAFNERIEASNPIASYGPEMFVDDEGRPYTDSGTAYENPETGFHASRRRRTPYRVNDVFDDLSRGRYHGGFLSGRPIGQWSRRDESGVLRLRGAFDRGRDGYFVVCREDGSTAWEGMYEEGELVQGRMLDGSESLFEEALVLAGHCGPVADISFSPDESTVATASYVPSYSAASDVTYHAKETMLPIVTLYDTESGACRVLEFRDYPVEAQRAYSHSANFEIAFTPDGESVVAIVDWHTGYEMESRLIVCHVSTGQRVIDTAILPSRPLRVGRRVAGFRALFTDWPAHVAISPGSERIAAVEMSPNNFAIAVAWDLATGEELFRAPDLQACAAVGFSRDGAELLIGHLDGIEIRDSASGEKNGMIQAFDVPASQTKYDDSSVRVGFSSFAVHKGTGTFISRDVVGTVRQWDLDGRQERMLNGDGDNDGLVAFGVIPDHESQIEFVEEGGRLSRGLTARVWDFAASQYLHEERFDEVRFSVSDDGRYYAAMSGNRLEVRKTSDGEVVRSIEGVEPPFVLSPAGDAVATVRVLEREPAILVSRVVEERQALFRSFSPLVYKSYPVLMTSAAVFSPTGRFVAAVDSNFCVRLWEVDESGDPSRQ